MAFEYSPHGFGASPLNPARCKASVHEPGRGMFIHQCSRKPWKDGWCGQHHPDSEKARQEAASNRWAAETRAKERNSALGSVWWLRQNGHANLARQVEEAVAAHYAKDPTA